jgi:hypothetical protein
MKITFMAIGLLVVPSISLGSAEVLEAPVPSKAPVGKSADMESTELEESISSLGFEGEGGYARDNESDEGGDEPKRGMRSSDDSTPISFDSGRKKSSRVRTFSKERLKEKFKEAVGSLRSRINSSDSLSESDEEDSALGSVSPRTDRSLSPTDEKPETELTTGPGASSDESLENTPEKKKSPMLKLRTLGMSREDHIEAYYTYRENRRSPSAPPRRSREGFRRHDTLKSKSDTRHNRKGNIGDNYGKTDV